MVRDPVERIISDYYYRRSVARKHIDTYNVTPSKFWLNKVSYSHSHLRDILQLIFYVIYYYLKPLEECMRRSDDECRFMTGYMQIGHMVPYFCGHHRRCS